MVTMNNDNYFLLKCKSDVYISQNGKCVTCNNGFIKRNESDNSMESSFTAKERIKMDSSMPVESGKNSMFLVGFFMHFVIIKVTLSH